MNLNNQTTQYHSLVQSTNQFLMKMFISKLSFRLVQSVAVTFMLLLSVQTAKSQCGPGEDMEDPVITCPADVDVLTDAGVCGALVTFDDPVVMDNCPLPTAMLGPLNFTTAGAAGRFGPTQGQIDAAYAGSDLEGLVVSTGGIQEWIVPLTGTYLIEARGAKGGGINGESGDGAVMIGEFDLVVGDVLEILVGQEGSTNDIQHGSGGGGSFVVLQAGTVPLIIAGGGGGRGKSGDNSYGNGDVGTAGLASGSSPGGINGGGGSAASGNMGGTATMPGSDAGGSTWASGGGGFLTNGGNYENGTYPGGLAYVNGGIGGQSGVGAIIPGAAAPGGFGGGGGAGDRGAGGGGYSGGAGAENNTFNGGGGGSLNTGINQVNASGANATNGLVIITLLDGGPVDAVTQTEGLPSGSLFPVGTTTNTYVATDDSGNTASCSFDITVTDAEAPEVLCTNLENLDVTTNQGECQGLYEWTIPTPTDNCGVVNYTVTYSNPDGSIDGPTDAFVFTPANDGNTSGGVSMAARNFDLGITTVTYYVEDPSGNTSTCSFDVEVTDDEDPVFVTCPPAGVTVDVFTNDCTTDIFWDIPTAEDNCDVTVTQTRGTCLW
jgi:hypothetical protein